MKERVEERLRCFWSPEQIVHREELPISVPTIYRAIRKGILSREIFQSYLRRKGKPYTRKGTETRGKLPGKHADPLAEVVTKIVKGKPCETITFDNGKEFARHQEMADALGTNVYFAHPHSPWERGTNENTNGLLRQFFPKGKSMAHVSQEDVDAAVHLLNNRPRKCLGWKTPLEAFSEMLHGNDQGCCT
jgi:IS30 family transposase